MNLTQIGKIARREYLTRVRSRAFIVMTALVPALLGLYGLVMPRIIRSERASLRLAVVDAGTGLGQAVADRLGHLERPKITVDEVATADSSDASARKRFTSAVQARQLDGYVLLDAAGDPPATRARYFTREAGNPTFVRDLTSTVRSAAVDTLLAGSGVDITRVHAAQAIDVDAVTVSDEGEREGGFERALASTMALAMLLYIAVLINGQGMATAIVEEKSSRLIEVILSAVTATEFMAGKILGVLGSGLTQLGVWVAVALAFLLQALPGMDLAASAAGFNLADFINLQLLTYFAIFFALGYLLYSVMFAAIAATCTSTEELAQSMLAAILPMVVGLMVAISVLTNPGTTATRVLSLIPFFTPLVMLARVNVLMPPLWEVWLGIAILLVTAVAAAWAAAKVFRYALLMTGKRPTLPELIQVIKAG